MIDKRRLCWKRTTTYTVLKKLCEKGIFLTENSRVSALISRQEFYAMQSEQFVEDTFNGSLPAFIAAFASRKKPSEEEIARVLVHSRKGGGGAVYLDLGADFEYPADWEQKGGVDVWLRIYDDDTDELVYYAWFTDYHYDGPYQFPICGGPPAEIPSYAGLSTLYATPVSGPEGYEKLFDGTVQTALLTSDTEGLVWKYDKAVKAVGYLLVGAGDDALHPERVPTGFLIYGSNDGTDWRMIGGRNHLGALEEASNYSERFFNFSDTDNMYQYFKLVINAPSEYQLSEIVVYQELQ